MTPEEFSAKLHAARQLIAQGLPAKVDAVVKLDLVALVKNRIVQRGEDYQGAPFTPYSTTPVPAWFYFGKGRSASANQAAQRLAKERKFVSYKEWRQINGLNTGIKNFEFTGEMLRSIEVQTKKVQTGVVRAVIQAGNKAAADKLKWSSEKEGVNLLLPSDAELKIIRDNLEQWVLQILKQT